MIIDWEERYEKGDTPWEKGYAAPPLTEFLSQQVITGKVLVPGCGTGHDVRALAGQGASVIGLDVAPRAIQRAKTFTCVSGENYILGDLFELPASLLGSFDWVFEHTCFCAISPERRKDYISVVHSVLKNNGALLAIFYLNPDNDGETGPPYPVSKKELDDLFSDRFELVKEWVPSKSYPGREGRELMRILKKRPNQDVS